MQKSLTIALAAAGLLAASQVSFANPLAPSPATSLAPQESSLMAPVRMGGGRWWWLRARRRRRNGPRRRSPKLRVRRAQPDGGTRTSDGTRTNNGTWASDGTWASNRTRASNGTWQSVCTSFPPWPFPRGAILRSRPGLRLRRLGRWKLLLELPVGRPRAKLLPGLRLGILRIDA